MQDVGPGEDGSSKIQNRGPRSSLGSFFGNLLHRVLTDYLPVAYRCPHSFRACSVPKNKITQKLQGLAIATQRPDGSPQLLCLSCSLQCFKRQCKNYKLISSQTLHNPLGAGRQLLCGAYFYIHGMIKRVLNQPSSWCDNRHLISQHGPSTCEVP